MTAALAGVWMIVGLFLDGLAHVELRPDSFFTPWHLILYSGFIAATIASTVPVVRRHKPGSPWMSAIPAGHALTLLGVAIFGVGAVFDLIWHEVVGFEVSNEALLSPSHLVLMLGATFALSGPLRTGWAERTSSSPIVSWLPMVISLALLTGVGLFFTSYVSPFGRQAAAVFPATVTHTHELEVANFEAFAQLREIWGISGILLSTLILLVPLMLLLRKAVPPPGAITTLGMAVGVFVPALGEFAQWTAGIAVVLAFGVADVVAQRSRSTVALGTVAALIFWSAYFTGLEITDDIGWSPSLWSGSIVLASMLGALIGFLVTVDEGAQLGGTNQSADINTT